MEDHLEGIKYIVHELRNGFKASGRRIFFIFPQIFVICDEFSKLSARKILRNFEKSSNMAKIWGVKMKKSLVLLALN